MRKFPEVLPLLIPIESALVTLNDGDEFDSRIIDISDVTSNPANALPDFGESLGISLTRAWVLAWAVRINLTSAFGWAGDNRTNLLLRVNDRVRGGGSSSGSESLVRLHIPAEPAVLVDDYVYTGSRIIHSIQAFVNIENLTGDRVVLDVDVWAKAW